MTHLYFKLLADHTRAATRATAMAVALATALAATLGTPSQAHAQDATAGGQKAQQCIGCHGIPGYQASFPEVHRVPKIAGQNTQYIVAALTEYRHGERKHPTMRAVAAGLSDQDIGDLAAYYHGLPSEKVSLPAKPDEAPSAHTAELLAKSNCVSCHGANFSAPIDPSYPKLAGQYPDYLYVALKAYQTKGNPNVGRTHAIMSAMAQPYTHEQLQDIANYLGSLPGELRTIEQSRFR